MRGGFPRAFLARSDAASFGWREDFIKTFIERDVPALGAQLRSPVNLRRLWSMLAHRHAQLWNGAELAAALGESYPTVKHHRDLLTGALVVRALAPWLANLEKRLVKSPKIYVRDSGMVTALLGLRTFRELEGHPGLGAVWEGFVLEELLARISDRDLFFWATHAGAELDFVGATGRSCWASRPSGAMLRRSPSRCASLSRISAYPRSMWSIRDRNDTRSRVM